jgi:hypothetical protein
MPIIVQAKISTLVKGEESKASTGKDTKLFSCLDCLNYMPKKEISQVFTMILFN